MKADQVTAANREVYENMDFDRYESNESLFGSQREDSVRRIIQSLAAEHGDRRFLDVGCGTGHVLRLATESFQECAGVDLGTRLLAELRRRHPGLLLSGGSGQDLPFPSDCFDAISCYGVLHHIVDPTVIFPELFRVLKPGGGLYTDHDVNWFFGRFYHQLYRLRYRNKPGFGDELSELAEYHNTQTGGLNPEKLRQALLAAGFARVEIHYRHSDNPGLPSWQKAIMGSLRVMARLCPLRSWHSHFSLRAYKE